jgi:sortase A
MAREGADTRTLRGAVGHVPSTALPGEQGNTAFAGHRDTFFRKLKDVRTGDAVIVTTGTGRHRYVVRDTRVVAPTDVWVLDPTAEATLTLVTCYPFNYFGSAPQRFIVRAALDPEGERRESAQRADPSQRVDQ